MTQRLEVYGTAEVAGRLGVTRATISRYLNPEASGYNERFPQPDARLACGPIWRIGTIERYLRRRGR